jgi:hypothetical protein
MILGRVAERPSYCSRTVVSVYCVAAIQPGYSLHGVGCRRQGSLERFCVVQQHERSRASAYPFVFQQKQLTPSESSRILETLAPLRIVETKIRASSFVGSIFKGLQVDNFGVFASIPSTFQGHATVTAWVVPQHQRVCPDFQNTRKRNLLTVGVPRTWSLGGGGFSRGGSELFARNNGDGSLT